MRRGLLLAILVLSVLLRLHGLGKDGFWFDEATTLLVAERGPGPIFKLCSGDNVPPAYHLALHFWLYGGRSEVWVRLLSVAFGVATVYVTWRLGNMLAGYPVGFYSALFVALSPANIAYSQEARMNSMAEFLVAASFLFLWAWVREGRGRRQIIGYCVCAAAAIYTHLFCLFVLMAQNVFVLFFSGLSSRKKAQWMFSQGCVLAVFVPWVFVVARQVQKVGEDFWLGRITPRAFLSLWHFLGTGGDFGDNYVLTALLNLPLLILFCAGLYSLFRRRPRPAAMLSSWLFVPVFSVGVTGIFFPLWLNRYFLVIFPAYALVIGFAVASLKSRLRNLIVLLVVLILAVSLHYQYVFVYKTRIKPAIGYIEGHYRPGDCIIHCVLKPRRKRPWRFDEAGWATFSYFPSIFYNRGRYPEFLLSREKVPFYLREDLLEPREVVSDFEHASAGYKRVWLVSWSKYEPQYGDEAALALAGHDFCLVTSLKFPSPGNDTVSLYLMERAGERPRVISTR